YRVPERQSQLHNLREGGDGRALHQLERDPHARGECGDGAGDEHLANLLSHVLPVGSCRHRVLVGFGLGRRLAARRPANLRGRRRHILLQVVLARADRIVVGEVDRAPLRLTTALSVHGGDSW
ncbi:hypothetical protein PMAYCL1PPCAC_25407, partial [Pristionchus mayeri]